MEIWCGGGGGSGKKGGLNRKVVAHQNSYRDFFNHIGLKGTRSIETQRFSNPNQMGERSEREDEVWRDQKRWHGNCIGRQRERGRKARKARKSEGDKWTVREER